MRSAILFVVLLAAFILAFGQPPASSSQEAKPLDPGVVDAYAYQVWEMARIVSDHYLQEIAPAKLCGFALNGMLEAAGPWAFGRLKGDVEKLAAKQELFTATARTAECLAVLETWGNRHACSLNPRGLAVLLWRFGRFEVGRIRAAVGDVPPLAGERAIQISLRAMIDSLDPHSAYISPEDALAGARDGNQLSPGLYFEERTGSGPLVVRMVLPNAPAHKAGIEPSDEVLEINGQSTEKLTAAKGLDRLTSGDAAEIQLSIRRDGKSNRPVKLQRVPLTEETVLGAARREDGGWDFMLDRRNKIGLIRLTTLIPRKASSYEEVTAADLKRAVGELRKDGMRSLILDLRECPGGALDTAKTCASVFLQGGTIAVPKYRNPFRGGDTLIADGEGAFTDFPMVVLSGPDTSGGGELIAAALQDHKRAAVAGQRSRGKATIQELPTNVLGQHGLKLTTGMFLRPSGKNLHRFPESKLSDDWGVRPDPGLEVRTSPQLRRQVRRWRLLQDLRSPQAREALPLDHPEADPVLFEAVKHLRKQIAERKQAS